MYIRLFFIFSKIGAPQSHISDNVFFFAANIFLVFTVICLIFSALIFGLGMTKDCLHVYTLHVMNFHQQIEQETCL